MPPVTVATAQRDDKPEETSEKAPPGPAELREALVSFGGCLAEKRPGFVRLTALTNDASKMVTPAEYSPPFRVKVRARTDSTNIRLHYSLGWVILNWEVERHKLMVGDLLRPIELAYPGKGYVKEKEWHDIVWEITEGRTVLLVDGEERFTREDDYGAIVSCVAIGPAWGSTVDVASFVVEALPGSPKKTKRAAGLAAKRAEGAGNGGGPERKARTLHPGWSSAERNGTYCIAWADYDKDGDPDLTVGNKWGPGTNQVYRNDGGKLDLAWTAPLEDQTENNGLAWGDWDGDGDPDLAVGADSRQPNRVYRNDGGELVLAWTSQERNSTFAVAWGDLDGDEDLDLATGNGRGEPSHIYSNSGGRLSLAQSFGEEDNTQCVAWADWDGDGDQDLALVNGGQEPVRIYRNTRGRLALAWTSVELHAALCGAWGDFDGDGDPDLAVASENMPNCLYRNDGGTLVLTWCTRQSDASRSVAWGDWDGDGDLDLAVGNEGNPNRVYENRDGKFSLAWSSYERDATVFVAWADVDGDGHPDLGVGNKGPNRVYFNVERKDDKDEVF